MNSIISWLGSARDYFLSQYYSASGWPFVGGLIGSVFYYLYLFFYYLTYYFGQFNSWLVWAAGRINQILDITTITSYFSTWINYATNAWSWVYSHFSNVVSDVTTWWSASNNPIKLYIQQAIAAITAIPDWLVSEFTKLKSAWDNFWNVTWPQWMTTLHDLGVSFLAFVNSIGQTILSHLNAFWDSTIFPALESIRQSLSSLNIPSWDEIWSFIFSKLPGIDDILNWWSETWTDVKDFFAEPTAWLLKRFSGDIFYSFLTPFIEDAGGTKEARDEAWKNIKPAEEEGDENLIILKDETLTQATIQGGMIEEETEKIKARIYGELG
jgi:hypothetical protein